MRLRNIWQGICYAICLFVLVGAGEKEVIDSGGGNGIPGQAKMMDGTKIGLVINEVYYSGPVNDRFYWYDQFIELYNPTDTTVFLDGLVFARTGYRISYERRDTTTYLRVLHCYQFPGNVGEKRYPVPPHGFVVIAKDALDHAKQSPGALNLERADWEFYNPYGRDIDNPAVPNVVNCFPEKRNDFNMNLDRGTVLLSLPYGIHQKNGQIYLPTEDVIDAVEYSVTRKYRKKLPFKLDAGIAAIGLHRYSGKSIQRIHPGFDTNNSSTDFRVTDTPTAGH